MAIFDEEKNTIERRGFRDILRRDTGTTPGTGRRFTLNERLELEKSIGKPYRSNISREEYKETLEKLEKERKGLWQNPETREKAKQIEDKIRYLNKVSGL